MSFKVQVSYEQAVLALKKAVAELGEDYVYKRIRRANGVAYCVYFNKDSSPSCLVGHVLAEAGLEPLEFESNENGTAVTRLADIGVIEYADAQDGRHSKTEALLNNAQCFQDGGYPWGDSVEEAIKAAQSMP